MEGIILLGNNLKEIKSGQQNWLNKAFVLSGLRMKKSSVT